jgi:ABC-type transport system involved in cytochrome c biogenesis permease subunit
VLPAAVGAGQNDSTVRRARSFWERNGYSNNPSLYIMLHFCLAIDWVRASVFRLCVFNALEALAAFCFFTWSVLFVGDSARGRAKRFCQRRTKTPQAVGMAKGSV